MKKETLFDYWLAIYTRRKAIYIIIAVSAITAVVLSFILKPVYEAKAVCYIPTSSPALPYMSASSIDKMARGTLVPSTKEDDAGPYIGLLKSRKIAEYTHEEFPDKSVEKMLLSDVDFELSDEFMLEIYSRDKDPGLAANVANAYMKYLNQLLQEASTKNPEKDAMLIKTKLLDAKKQLKEAKDELKTFEEKNHFVSIDEENKQLTEQRISFQSQLENVIVQITENEEKLRAYNEQLVKEGALLSKNSLILTSPIIEYLQKKLSDLAVQIAGNTVELKEAHPDAMKLNKQYTETSDRLEKEIENLVASQIKPGAFYEQLRQNLVDAIINKDKLLATKKGYKEVIERIDRQLQKLPLINSEWQRLNDNVEHYKKIYEQLRTGLQESEMQQSRPIQYVIPVDFAQPPKTPAFPVMWLNVIVAIFVGILAGVLYAFFVDYIEGLQKVRVLKAIKAVLAESKD